MRDSNIKVGHTMLLKPERQEAYGAKSPFVPVTGIKPRGGHYRSVWIMSGTDAYKPSDFLREATRADVAKYFSLGPVETETLLTAPSSGE